MSKSTNVVIELYDGWSAKQGIAWRQGVILQQRSQDDPAQLGQALEQKLQQVKELMTQEALLKYWYSYQVGGLLIVLSQEIESGYKSVPRLQPRQGIPEDAKYRFVVYLGPEKGAYAIEGYQLAPMPNSQGVIQQFTPIAWSQATGQPA